MGEYQTASVSPAQPLHAIRTPTEKTPLLKLQTSGPANVAYLEQDGSGLVYLYFRGLRFGVDDYVPDSLIRSQAIAQKGTAGKLVWRQMLTLHGYHEDKWPVLARQFLLQHVAFPRAARSRATGWTLSPQRTQRTRRRPETRKIPEGDAGSSALK